MKRKLIITALLMIYFPPALCHAEVQGRINEKFQDNFPKNILAVMPKEEKAIGASVIKIFKKHKVNIIESDKIYKGIDEGFFCNLLLPDSRQKNGCFYELPNEFMDKLPENMTETLKQYSDIDGLLTIYISNSTPLPPFDWLTHSFAWVLVDHDTASVTIYDTRTGEWVYNLDFECGFNLSKFSDTNCEITSDSMTDYLKGDLKKKLKNVKFRQ